MTSLTTYASRNAPSLGLSQRQLAILVATGIVLWFVAAILLRTIGPTGALEGSAVVISYTLTIPGTIPFVLLIRKLAGIANDQTFLAMAIVTGSALLLDGIAVAYFPSLYGAEMEQVARAAGAVLWGAGVAIALGYFMNTSK
jgi:hypothetical protein